MNRIQSNTSVPDWVSAMRGQQHSLEWTAYRLAGPFLEAALEVLPQEVQVLAALL